MRLPPAGPIRALTVSTFLNAAGSGLTVTTLVLYFTRIVGISGGHVALGLTLGGALGVAVSLPLGQLADRLGALRVMLGLLVLQAAVTLAFVFATSLAAYLAVAVVAVAAGRGASAVRQGIIARALPSEGAVRARAGLRSATNAGFALGTAVATAGIVVDTAVAYRALFVADALSFLVVAWLLRGLSGLAPIPREPPGRRLAVLRDRPYLAVIAITSLLALGDAMLEVGIPLWVAHTAAPTAVVGVIFVLNCLVVTAFSVRVAGDRETPEEVAGAAARAGVSLLLACVLVAVAGALGAVLATAVLIAGMLLQSLGEMQEATSQWGLTLGFAPAERQGQYQGAAATGIAIAQMAGPLVMAGVVAAGAAGWLGFGVLLLVAGLATPPVVGWVVRARVRAA